jgi:hypothetical protein
MIQSHSLQVLSLVAMEAPSTLGARDLRDGKAQVLRAGRVWDDEPARWSRRARYTAGVAGSGRLPSYVDEDGVDPGRGTETLAEVVLAVDTWRWAGVPFRLRAGKALRTHRARSTAIRLYPCAQTRPSRAGASSSRCSTPGAMAASHWRNTRPEAPGRQAGDGSPSVMLRRRCET